MQSLFFEFGNLKYIGVRVKGTQGGQDHRQV